MRTLLWQTGLLLLGSYFLGAWIACLIRRTFFAGLSEDALQTAAPPAPVRRPDPVTPLSPAMRALPPEPGTRRFDPARTGAAHATSAAAAATAPASAASAVAAEDLTRIRGIDEGLRPKLQELGVRTFDQIAKWRAEDVARIGAALGIRGRIERENWIEQTQVLASGAETNFSRRKARGEIAAASPTPDEGERIPLPAATAAPLSAAGPPRVDERAAFARPQAGARRDDLRRIRGIGAELEQLLNAEGVSRYSQIAQWTAGDVARFEALPELAGRIARENWIEQAQILARGGETAFSREFDGNRAAPSPRPSLAEAIRATADLTVLRSVRSEAYRAQETPPGTGASAAGADDLKRIRGVGVLIEKKLNSMGTTRYEQIANWTSQDIERVSAQLDFKGRIERENWVEQARILASGGQTEFSRRVDSGAI